jgi:periplasmic protein TonB
VIEQPKLGAPIELKSHPPAKIPEARAVFGISRRALTEGKSSSEESAGIEVKAGNTLAVAPDDKTLRPDDAESLPIPTEEFLVTEMPRLLAEVRIPYPKEAKEKGIEGPVVMGLLIDVDGNVRDATLLEGPGHGLDEAAMEAVRRLRFSPAKVEKKAVAVRIRYIYRFVLEN